MKIEEAIKAQCGEIRHVAERHGASNVRVFGSVAHVQPNNSFDPTAR